MSEARALLEWSRAALGHPDLAVVAAWPRACALLARQALEEGVDDFWLRTMPTMRSASRTTQLACLGQFLRDPDLVDGVRVAWSALSRACHHHAYELSPIAPELDHWLTSVEALIARLDQADAA